MEKPNSPSELNANPDQFAPHPDTKAASNKEEESKATETGKHTKGTQTGPYIAMMNRAQQPVADSPSLKCYCSVV